MPLASGRICEGAAHAAAQNLRCADRQLRLADRAPGQDAHAGLADAVVEVLGIAEHLDVAAGREHQMLIDDERRGRARRRRSKTPWCCRRWRRHRRPPLPLPPPPRAGAQRAVAVGVVGRTADERERIEVAPNTACTASSGCSVVVVKNTMSPATAGNAVTFSSAGRADRLLEQNLRCLRRRSRRCRAARAGCRTD